MGEAYAGKHIPGFEMSIFSGKEEKEKRDNVVSEVKFAEIHNINLHRTDSGNSPSTFHPSM